MGGGVQVEPIAVVAIAKDGKPRLMAIDGEPEQMPGQLLDQVPTLIGRVIGLFTRKGVKDEAVRLQSAEPAMEQLVAKTAE